MLIVINLRNKLRYIDAGRKAINLENVGKLLKRAKSSAADLFEIFRRSSNFCHHSVAENNPTSAYSLPHQHTLKPKNLKKSVQNLKMLNFLGFLGFYQLWHII